MLRFKHYLRPDSLEEAWKLSQGRANVILGGTGWLKMGERTWNNAVDLSGLGLNQIEETEKGFRIGAMVTLRQLELHPGLDRLTQGAMAESVRHIVGVQFRNLATVGGSVLGRFGFSDVLTLLLALEARVVLYHGGGAVPGGLRCRPPAAGHPHPRDHPQGGAAGGLSVPAEHRHRLSRPHLRPVPAGGADAVRRGGPARAGGAL